jgi:hypothetical protein
MKCQGPAVGGAGGEPGGVSGGTACSWGPADSEARVRTAAQHEVNAETSGAHSHDHTHGPRSSVKFTGTCTTIFTLAAVAADAELNGHTHARPHERRPWSLRSRTEWRRKTRDKKTGAPFEGPWFISRRILAYQRRDAEAGCLLKQSLQ